MARQGIMRCGKRAWPALRAMIALCLLAFPAFGFDDPDHAPGAPGLAVGFNQLRWQDDAALRAEFRDYQRLGVRWLRTDLYWADVQAEGPESYDWAETDRLVDLAAEFDLRLLLVVGTTPDWAKAAEDNAAGSVRDAYARFLTEAVRRYAPRGVGTWEIWNEPNLASNWPPHPDPRAYAALLIAGYEAVKAADPEAFVLLGGLSPVPRTGPFWDVQHHAAVDFLQEVYKAGAGGSFDAVSFHPYSYPDLPVAEGAGHGWAMMSQQIRKVMRHHGDGDKPIWITEFGAPTNHAETGVSEQDQARILAEGWRLAMDSPWAGPFFWYSYRDQGSDPEQNEQWFGIVNEAGRQKPAWREFEGFSRRVWMGQN